MLYRWWKALGVAKKLTFCRDRIVECYFWSLGVYFEPHYSRARIYITKVIALLSIMDDIYDAYGMVEELQAFTEVIQRFEHLLLALDFSFHKKHLEIA